jgi:hypothetical protein
MLDSGFNAMVFFCILALIILLIITRIARSFRQARRLHAELMARERAQVRSTAHDMPVIRVSNGRVSEYEPAYQEDYGRDASSYLYKDPQRLPGGSVQRFTLGKVRHDFVYTLQAPPVILIAVLRLRAILLYQEQNGSTWQEAWQVVHELEGADAFGSGALEASTSQGIDPMVTYFLLRAGYRDDAIAYFCWGSGASLPEATDAIDFFLQHIMGNGTSGPDLPQRTPDLNTIRFLLQMGHRLVAIRYYRDCTGASVTAASDAVVAFQREIGML